jgi:hypothetical protein
MPPTAASSSIPTFWRWSVQVSVEKHPPSRNVINQMAPEKEKIDTSV